MLSRPLAAFQLAVADLLSVEKRSSTIVALRTRDDPTEGPISGRCLFSLTFERGIGEFTG